MASKCKKRSKRRPVAQLFKQVQRNLERGNAKQALKDAKVCYRQTPSQEHRTFLECAYMARAQELERRGFYTESRSVVEELLALPVTEPSVEAGLPDLVLSLGMLDCLPSEQRANLSDASDPMCIRGVDLAVLRPQVASASALDIRSNSLRIREALTAVEGGDEKAALVRLKDIARTSPFADWKLFVRGLAAYYRKDEADMLANWDRLDPERTAARIAAPLKALAGPGRGRQKDAALRAAIERLECALTDHALLRQLDRIGPLVSEENWPDLLRLLPSVVQRLRQVNERLPQRLVEYLASRLIGQGTPTDLDALAKIAGPLPLDPHWDRARALLTESVDPTDVDEASVFWLRYVNDLETVPRLSPDERRLAQAIVLTHLGQRFSRKAVTMRRCPCGMDHTEDVESAELEAEELFERSLSLAPQYRLTYESMAQAFEVGGEPDKVAATYHRVLKHLPDDIDALQYLATYYVTQGEPTAAVPFALKLREQKPLDKHVAQLAAAAHFGCARHYAVEGDFERGRAEFAKVDRLLPERRKDYDVLVRKAAFANKAGCVEESERLLTQAVESVPESAPVWLQMMIESNRYELPERDRRLYEKRWTTALRSKCHSQTAGVMCKLMTAHLVSQPAYSGRSGHVEELKTYVARCSRVKWHCDDLYEVCVFLETSEDAALLRKYASKGRRLFSKEAYFHWIVGNLEFLRGPHDCNHKLTCDCFQRVLEQAKESTYALDEERLATVERRLRLLRGEVYPMESYPFDGDDDEDDELDDELEGELDDELLDLIDRLSGEARVTAGISSAMITVALRKVCGNMGLNFEEMLSKIMGQGGLQGGTSQRNSTNRRKRSKRRSR